MVPREKICSEFRAEYAVAVCGSAAEILFCLILKQKKSKSACFEKLNCSNGRFDRLYIPLRGNAKSVSHGKDFIRMYLQSTDYGSIIHEHRGFVNSRV